MRKWASIVALVGCAAGGPEALMTSGDIRTQPWPTDALVGSDGKLQVAPPFPFDGRDENEIQLGQSLSELDGFGTTTSVFFPVSEDVTVESGATAQVIDLEGSEPDRAFPLLYRADTKQLVAVAPFGTVLSEHHRYACVIERGVHSLHMSSAMDDAVHGHGALGKTAAYQALSKKIKGAQAATAFTTRSVSAWAAQVLSDLAAMPPAATVTRTFQEGVELDGLFGGAVTTTRPGLPPSGGVLHDQIGLAIEGTLQSPNYLSASPSQLGFFSDPPAPKSVADIPFLLVLPKNATTNVPVVIFQHGIGSDRSAMLLVANDYAAHGYAIFGIDELWHGSRQPNPVDNLNNLTMAMDPDGIGDPKGFAVGNFFDFSGDASQNIAALDPRIMRDNFRQATADLMQTVRMAKFGDWSAAGVTLDGSKLVYTGESFGSILGAEVMALDPEAEAAVLDVGGGGLLLDLVGNSASFALVLQPFVSGGFDEAFDVNHPDVLPIRAQMSINFMQTLLEPGDGLSLSSARAPGKSILFLEASNDEVVANHSTESLATAWGATQVMLASGSPPTRVVKLPELDAPQTGNPIIALVQLDPACHGMFTRQTDQRKWEDGFPPFVMRDTPPDVNNPIERAHALALGFIDGFRSGQPLVLSVP